MRFISRKEYVEKILDRYKELRETAIMIEDEQMRVEYLASNLEKFSVEDLKVIKQYILPLQ